MARNKIYFTKDAENAIVECNEMEDQVKKSKVYRERIEKPLNKLVENIINRFKFPYFREVSENLQFEVVSFLVVNMHKYQQDKGKAFSYFSILAKNHLILNNTGEYKYKKIKQRIDESENDYIFDIVGEDQEIKLNDDVPEFITLMIEYWENNLSYIFTKRQEIMIADAIITLFKHSHSIENHNKKSLYLMIREMTGLRTQYITAVVNKMRKHIVFLQESYNTTGYFNTNDSVDKFI